MALHLMTDVWKHGSPSYNVNSDSVAYITIREDIQDYLDVLKQIRRKYCLQCTDNRQQIINNSHCTNQSDYNLPQ